MLSLLNFFYLVHLLCNPIDLSSFSPNRFDVSSSYSRIFFFFFILRVCVCALCMWSGTVSKLKFPIAISFSNILFLHPSSLCRVRFVSFRFAQLSECCFTKNLLFYYRLQTTNALFHFSHCRLGFQFFRLCISDVCVTKKWNGTIPFPQIEEKTPLNLLKFFC